MTNVFLQLKIRGPAPAGEPNQWFIPCLFIGSFLERVIGGLQAEALNDPCNRNEDLP